MNKHAKRKWVKALRSGEYAKGIGGLGDLEGERIRYCCLGVFAEEMVPELVGAQDQYGIRVDDNACFLPDDLAIMYDLSDSEQTRLAELNDDNETHSDLSRTT